MCQAERWRDSSAPSSVCAGIKPALLPSLQNVTTVRAPAASTSGDYWPLQCFRFLRYCAVSPRERGESKDQPEQIQGSLANRTKEIQIARFRGAGCENCLSACVLVEETSLVSVQAFPLGQCLQPAVLWQRELYPG